MTPDIEIPVFTRKISSFQCTQHRCTSVISFPSFSHGQLHQHFALHYTVRNYTAPIYTIHIHSIPTYNSLIHQIWTLSYQIGAITFACPLKIKIYKAFTGDLLAWPTSRHWKSRFLHPKRHILHASCQTPKVRACKFLVRVGKLTLI